MDTTDINIETVKQMSDEEIRQLNQKVARHFAKFVLVKVGVTIAVVAAVHYVGKKLDARWDAEFPETPEA